jgi:hypothetical protein
MSFVTIGEDCMVIIFSYLNHIQIGEMFQASKYLNSLKRKRFYARLFYKTLNRVINNDRTISEMHVEYRLKMCILERINDTLIEFKKLMDNNGITNWFVSGGMAMRYNSFNRMTYDLDIFVLDNIICNDRCTDQTLNFRGDQDFDNLLREQDVDDFREDQYLDDLHRNQDINDLRENQNSYDFRIERKQEQEQNSNKIQFNKLEWWQTTIDKILEINNWIHVADPNQSPELYNDYGHSWAHPINKIKVDIIQYNNKEQLQLFELPNGIRYPSIDTLAKIKKNSILQRVQDDNCGKQKDLEDYMNLAQTTNILNEVNELKSRYMHKQYLNKFNELETRRDYWKLYIISHNLQDDAIPMDIIFSHKPPKDHLAWNCWRQCYECFREGPFNIGVDLPFEVPYEPYSCKSCQQKDDAVKSWESAWGKISTRKTGDH